MPTPTTTKKGRKKKPGTWLSIYCSAKRGCWGPALLHIPLLPVSKPPFQNHPHPSFYFISVTEQAVSRALSLSSVSLVPSSGAEGVQLSTPSAHILAPFPCGNSGHLGVLAYGSLLP